MNWEFWLDPVKTRHALWRQLLCCSTFSLVTSGCPQPWPRPLQPHLSLGPGEKQCFFHCAPLSVMGSSHLECSLMASKALLGLWERRLRWITNMHTKRQEGDKHSPQLTIFSKPTATINLAQESVPAPLPPGKLCTGVSCATHRQGYALRFHKMWLTFWEPQEEIWPQAAKVYDFNCF